MKNPHVRIGTPPFKIVSNEEQYLVEAMAYTTKSSPRGHMYASTAANCPRQNFGFASQESIETTTTAESTLYMQIGNGIEAALAEGLNRKGKLLGSNFRMPVIDPHIGGKVDLVYVDQFNEVVIGEVKSCGDLPSEPKYSYMRQLLTYLAIGGFRTGSLVFVSRNVVGRNRKAAVRAFTADVTDESLFDVLKQIVYTQRCIDLKVLPPIPVQFKKSVHCSYCIYKDSCWGEGTDWDPFMRLGDLKLEVEHYAEEKAAKLMETRDERYVTALRHIWHELDPSKKALRARIIEEAGRFGVPIVPKLVFEVS